MKKIRKKIQNWKEILKHAEIPMRCGLDWNWKISLSKIIQKWFQLSSLGPLNLSPRRPTLFENLIYPQLPPQPNTRPPEKFFVKGLN